MTGILDAAARAIARRGDAASMSDVAAEAGVARATLYRYFGSRGALEDAVVGNGVARAADALRAARIGDIAVQDGISRAVRSLLDTGEALVVIMRRRALDAAPEFDSRVAGPLRRLIHAGQRDGRVRDDVPTAWLTESLMSLVVNALSAPSAMGKEDTIATVSGFFLDGAGTRPAATDVDLPNHDRAGGDDG